VLLEGEEEIGSPNLEPFIVAHHARLAGSEIAVISDTNQWDIDTPALTASVRGMAYVEVRLKGASRDLHSGMYGGSALNAINALTRALGQLHDDEGRVQIPGFYDGVEDISEAQKAAWQSLGFSEHDFLGDIGLSVPVGERDRSALERLWVRPTADINGIWGGYQGPGSKTVIAAEAGAKISFRLVPGQSPSHIVAGFKQFMAARVPEDAQLSFIEHANAPGLAIDTGNRFVGAARAGNRQPDDGFRPVRRQTTQPKREIRNRLLPPRPAQPCALFGRSRTLTSTAGVDGGTPPPPQRSRHFEPNRHQSQTFV